MVAAELLLLAAAAHVQRMQMSDVAHQMRQRRRRILLMDLAFHWQTPLTTRQYTKVERSPNGWMSSTMYGYVFGKGGVRNSDDVWVRSRRSHPSKWHFRSEYGICAL